MGQAMLEQFCKTLYTQQLPKHQQQAMLTILHLLKKLLKMVVGIIITQQLDPLAQKQGKRSFLEQQIIFM